MFESITSRLAEWPLPTVIVGVALLLAGGWGLVEGAVGLARRLGISPLIIGLTIVAFGTSAPELSFNIIASLNENSDLTFGNVIGSNIANIGLVLGLSALIAPLTLHSAILSREAPMLMAVTLLALAMGLLPPHATIRGTPADGYATLDGLILLFCFLVFLAIWLRVAQSDRNDPVAREMIEQAGPVESVRPIGASLVYFVAGLALLIVGGKATEIGAVGLARMFGLSEAIIGLTIIAIATSLPEVATSIIAAARGQTDIAIGNVIGSNVFNLLLVLGASAVISPVAVPRMHGQWDLIAMTIMTAVLLAFVLVGRHTISRLAGAFLVLLYIATIGWSAAREMGIQLIPS